MEKYGFYHIKQIVLIIKLLLWSVEKYLLNIFMMYQQNWHLIIYAHINYICIYYINSLKNT